MHKKRYPYSGVTTLTDAVERMQDLLETINRNLNQFEPELRKTGRDPDLWSSNDLKLIFDKYIFVDD